MVTQSRDNTPRHGCEVMVGGVGIEEGQRGEEKLPVRHITIVMAKVIRLQREKTVYAVIKNKQLLYYIPSTGLPQQKIID